MPVAWKQGASAAVITLAIACSSATVRSPEQERADAATAKRLHAALADDPVYFFQHVDVSVHDGVARLSGLVFTPDALFQAERIARAVPGVTRVDDYLDLDLEGSKR